VLVGIGRVLDSYVDRGNTTCFIAACHGGDGRVRKVERALYECAKVPSSSLLPLHM